MMRVGVLDVGHGSCAYLIADDGRLVLFDCGHKTDPEEVRPSSHFAGEGFTTVSELCILNYDEDHISDLPELRRRLSIEVLFRNRTISVEQLRNLKLQSGPISAAMSELLGMMGIYIGDVSPPLVFPRVEMISFCNPYGQTFSDTNNTSLVVWLNAGGKVFLLPGDLETAGWEALLRREDFRAALQSVNVFFASHHGRENGYCADVFRYCNPEVIVVSDSHVQFATQAMVNTYRSHATGVPFNGETRRVLTTRRDGSFWWDNL